MIHAITIWDQLRSSQLLLGETFITLPKLQLVLDNTGLEMNSLQLLRIFHSRVLSWQLLWCSWRVHKYCLAKTGKIVGTSSIELKKLFGIYTIIGCITCSRIYLYWNRNMDFQLLKRQRHMIVFSSTVQFTIRLARRQIQNKISCGKFNP